MTTLLFCGSISDAAAGWVPLLEAAATCTAAYFFLYTALARGDVSSVMPMMGSKVIFSGLAARVMMGESHSGAIYLAALLVAAAVAALSYSPGTGAGAVVRRVLAATTQRRSRRMPPGGRGLPGRSVVAAPDFAKATSGEDSAADHGTLVGGPAKGSALKPAGLMLTACVVFAFTDVYIRRSLAFMDPYSFMVYYNGLVGVGALLVIPHLRKRGVSLRVSAANLLITLLAAAFLLAATSLFVVSFDLAKGVVVPNILMSTRGVFIVLISAAMNSGKRFALDRQNRWTYLLRLAASAAIIFAVWLALS